MKARQQVPARRHLVPPLILCAALLVIPSMTGCGNDPEPPEPIRCELRFVYPTEGATLTALDDRDPGREGLQIPVQLSVAVCPLSGTISLETGSDAGSIRTLPAHGIATYTFADYTLPEGSVTLTARLHDSLGNLRASAEILFTVEPIEPPEYSLAFEEPGEDDLVLGPQEDADGNLANGLQFDIVVGSTNLPMGTRVDLWVSGRQVPPAGIDADGKALFAATTLPESRSAPLLLVATADHAGQLLSANRRVRVDTGSCEVTIEPEPNLAGCDLTDPTGDLKPSVEGYQSQVTVYTECSDVTLTINEIAQSAPTSQGQVSFLATFQEGANLVSVSALDANTERSGRLDGLVYHVDTEPPLVTVSYPDGSQDITRLEDQDVEMEGIQVTVQGSCTDSSLALMADSLQVSALLDGIEAASDETDQDGRFLLGQISFLESKSYTLEIRCTDPCGTQGTSGPILLTVSIEPPQLVINSPEDGAVLTAEGDLLPEEPGYQTAFEVETTHISSDTEVWIECRRPALYLYERIGGAVRGEDLPFQVPVTLPEGESFCRAAATQGTTAVRSEEIRLVVSSHLPWVVIVQPESGAVVAQETTVLSAFLDPEVVEVWTCLNEEPCILLDDPEQFTENGLYIPSFALQPGPNSIVVLVADQLGSEGSDSVEVTCDLTPPELTFIDPAGAEATLEQSDLYDGYLYDLVVQMNEEPLGGEICLVANQQAERCVGAVESAGDWQAEFDATFLLPGENLLLATGRDLAGNQGTATQQLTVNSPLPRLEIVTAYTVDEQEVTIDEFTPLDGQIIGWEGRIDVLVTSSGLTEEIGVSLVTNDLPSDPLTPGLTGELLFPQVPILDETDDSLAAHDGWNTLQAVVEGGAGRSATVLVRRDTTPPSLDFHNITEGMYLSPANGFPDMDPQDGYQVDIWVDTAGMEDGQIATLSVDCAGTQYDAEYTATVSQDQALFRVERLPDVGSCTLTATGSDRAGYAALPATRAVLVDRIGPTIVFSRPRDGDHIDFQDDQDLTEPGIQYDVSVRVTGAVGELQLYDQQRIAIDETASIPAPTASTIQFSEVTLPDGELILVAAASDAAGNQTLQSIRITVQSAGISLDFFALQQGSILNTLTDLSAGQDGWQGNIDVVVNAAYPGQTILLCLYDPQGTGIPGEPSCSQTGWVTLNHSTLNATGLSGTFYNVSLLDGEPRIKAEMVLGDTRIFSPAIQISVDTVRPIIQSWTLTNDTVAWVMEEELAVCSEGADHLLNQVEAPTRLANVVVQFEGLSGNRPVSIYDLGVNLISSGITTGDTYSFTATLSEQGHQLNAVVSDIHNNPLASGSPTLSMAIDTTPPTLSWLYPTSGMVLLAADDSDGDPENDLTTQVRLNTDTNPGIPVHLTYQETHLAGSPATIGDGTPPIQVDTHIPQGAPVPLQAVTWDTACNQRTASITLPIVDVRPPTIAIMPPQAVDYEMDLEVVTTYAESGQEIRVSADGLGLVGSALIQTVPAPDEPVTTAVPIVLPGGTWTVQATVKDISGNPAESDPYTLPALPLRGCGLIFVEPTGNPIYINAEGYTGTPPDDPKAVQVVLRSVDPYCRGETAFLRLGCALDAEDPACALVLSDSIGEDDFATFEVNFYHGQQTTMHGRATNPVTLDLGTTDQKNVTVDLVFPEVTLDGPLAGSELGWRLAMASADWSVEGTSLVGPLSFTTSGAANGQVTARYHGGPVLADSAGPILQRALSSDGAHTLTGVRFPTADEQEVLCQGYTESAIGVCLEVAVSDQAGNTVTAAVPVNADADLPPQPQFSAVDRDPTIQRSGRVDLQWTAVNDDTTGGGPATRYEIRAVEDPAPDGWLGSQPANIITWETQAELLAEVFPPDDPALAIEQLGFDSDWHIGLRAFDELDNWSAGIEVLPIISTRLQRQTIGPISGCATDYDVLSSLGDVNGDGLDDLLLACPGHVVLMLGETDPANPIIPSNPFVLTPVDDQASFGMSSAGVGDVNGDGLNDFTVGSWGDSAVYLYFGSENLDGLSTHDVTINGPASTEEFTKNTGFILSRTGRGNFADVGSGASPYDDLLVLTAYWDGETGAPIQNTVFIVLGRSAEEWAALGGSLTIDDSDPESNCEDNGILALIGEEAVAPGFAFHSGVAIINEDSWADLVLSTDYTTAKHSTQYLYYGESLSACPTSAWTLDDADEVVETAGNTSQYYLPDIAVRQSDLAGPKGEFAVGLWRYDDLVSINSYESGVGLGLLAGVHQDVPSQRFGFSIAFAGDLDQDTLGQPDMVVGAPASTNYPTGGLWVILASDNLENRFEEASVWSVDLSDPSDTTGWTATGGFDYNGDGYPDLAVADPGNESIILLY
ncbi:MAG: VCBS repeat-containing protein [Bradymonadales bacterium]|nr:VCBS repeat-containing protein [Bradymonadales bacterium]